MGQSWIQDRNKIWKPNQFLFTVYKIKWMDKKNDNLKSFFKSEVMNNTVSLFLHYPPPFFKVTSRWHLPRGSLSRSIQGDPYQSQFMVTPYQGQFKMTD